MRRILGAITGVCLVLCGAAAAQEARMPRGTVLRAPVKPENVPYEAQRGGALRYGGETVRAVRRLNPENIPYEAPAGTPYRRPVAALRPALAPLKTPFKAIAAPAKKSSLQPLVRTMPSPFVRVMPPAPPPPVPMMVAAPPPLPPVPKMLPPVAVSAADEVLPVLEASAPPPPPYPAPVVKAEKPPALPPASPVTEAKLAVVPDLAPEPPPSSPEAAPLPPSPIPPTEETSVTPLRIVSDPLGTASLATPAPIPLPKGAPERSCAQLQRPQGELSLVDVIHFTLCNNSQTRQSWADIERTAAQLGQNRAGYLPSVSATDSYNRSKFSADGSPDFKQTRHSPEASLSYLLYDFGGREASVDFTKRSLSAANYTYNATLQRLVFSAIQAYYQLFSARESVNAAVESEKASQTSLDAATLRYSVGAVAIADKLQADTAYQQTRLRREQAENQLHISEGVLANIMGLDPNAPLTLTQVGVSDFSESFTPDVARLIDYAKKARPELAASRESVESAKEGIRVANARGLPNVTFDASRQYNYVKSGPGVDDDSSVFGVTLRIPIFGGFSNSYQIKEAEADLAGRMADKERLEKDIALEVWQSYQNYLTARQALETTKALVTSAEQASDVALGRYKQGAGSFIDLLNAQAQLADARQQRVGSVYDWLITRADLVRAVGNYDFLTIGEAESGSR